MKQGPKSAGPPATTLQYTILPDRSRRGRWIVRMALWLTLLMPLSLVTMPFVLVALVHFFGMWSLPDWVDWLMQAFSVAIYGGPIAALILALVAASLTRRFRPAIVMAILLSLIEGAIIIWSRWT